MLGTPEIILIAAVVMVLFGATAIPKFARSIGKAKKEFEEGMKEGKKDLDGKKKEEAEDKAKEGNKKE